MNVSRNTQGDRGSGDLVSGVRPRNTGVLLSGTMSTRPYPEVNLTHFDSAGFSKFFPQNPRDDSNADEFPHLSASPDQLQSASQMPSNHRNDDRFPNKNLDTRDLVDDFERLNRIFSNENLKFNKNHAKTASNFLSERDSRAFDNNNAPHNGLYGSQFAYASANNGFVVGPGSQAKPNGRVGSGADMQNTSLTTATSVGNLEKNEHTTSGKLRDTKINEIIDGRSVQNGFYQQSPMFFGYMPQSTQHHFIPPGYPNMMQIPITEEGDEVSPYYGNGGNNLHMGMSQYSYGNQSPHFFGGEYQGKMTEQMFNNPSLNSKKFKGAKAPFTGGNFAGNQGEIGQNQGKIGGIGGQKSGKSRHHDDELYEIDVNRIEGIGKTTLMVKNIPNKYNLPLILETLDNNHKGTYDFFYLPIDFRNKCNVGYAFINFADPRFIKSFYEEFSGKKWEKFNSEKVCEIKYARIQGRDALIQHFQYSSVMNQTDKKLKPVIMPKSDLSTIESLVQQQKVKTAREESQIYKSN